MVTDDWGLPASLISVVAAAFSYSKCIGFDMCTSEPVLTKSENADENCYFLYPSIMWAPLHN